MTFGTIFNEPERKGRDLDGKSFSFYEKKKNEECVHIKDWRLLSAEKWRGEDHGMPIMSDVARVA